MASGSDVIGTWEDVFGASRPEMQGLARAARDLVRRVHPGVIEVARPGERAVTFGTGPRKMKDGYAYLMPHKAWINLGFYQGAALPDPLGLLEGTGAALRHVKLRSGLPEGVEDLIRAAVALRAG